jgi:predicted transcriptional regulator
MLNDSPCESIGKWETCVHFERRQIVGVRLIEASVTETATLLDVSRVAVSKVMSAYTNHGKTSAKRNSGRKSTLTERGRRTLRRAVSKNRTTTAEQVNCSRTEYSS